MSGAAVWPLKTGSSWEQVLTLAVDVPSQAYTGAAGLENPLRAPGKPYGQQGCHCLHGVHGLGHTSDDASVQGSGKDAL